MLDRKACFFGTGPQGISDGELQSLEGIVRRCVPVRPLHKAPERPRDRSLKYVLSWRHIVAIDGAWTGLTTAVTIMTMVTFGAWRLALPTNPAAKKEGRDLRDQSRTPLDHVERCRLRAELPHAVWRKTERSPPRCSTSAARAPSCWPIKPITRMTSSR